ncbi:MAG: hypothetical protein ACK5A2_02615, partial [Bacteroidota bacterium]
CNLGGVKLLAALQRKTAHANPQLLGCAPYFPAFFNSAAFFDEQSGDGGIVVADPAIECLLFNGFLNSPPLITAQSTVLASAGSVLGAQLVHYEKIG